MIKLYTASTPNGRKISIALEELGLDYETEALTLDGSHITPEFLALNPNHKIPVLDDDGVVVWESGAILLHLCEKYDDGGILLPRDPVQRIHAIQYAFFQAGGVGPNLGAVAKALRLEEPNPQMVEIFSTECERLCGVLDRILSDDRQFLAGPYTIGDVMHYPWLAIARNLNFPGLMKFDRVLGWLDRIAARPAVERGMAVPAS